MYAIMRVQKFKQTAVRGIEIHDFRKTENSHTNPDINREKSYLNFDLENMQEKSYDSAVKKRISELNLKKNVRKDAVVMSQILVTASPVFFEYASDRAVKKYFEDSFNFLCEKFGAENIISAVVHYDEKSPHMHFNFVPVTADGRLAAKSVLTKSSLWQLHSDFATTVAYKYNLKRGEDGGSGKKHYEVAEYKALTRLDDLANTIAELEEKKNSIMTSDEVSNLTAEKTLLGGLKGISYSEFDRLKKTASQVDLIADELELALQEKKLLQEKYRKLTAEAKKQCERFEVKITELEDNIESQEQEISHKSKKINELQQKIKLVKDFLKTSNIDLYDEYLRQHEPNSTEFKFRQNHKREIERGHEIEF